MNINKLLINHISEVVHNNAIHGFENKVSLFCVAPFPHEVNIDTKNLWGNHLVDKCLFYFSRNIEKQKQKWGFYVRANQRRSILWGI